MRVLALGVVILLAAGAVAQAERPARPHPPAAAKLRRAIHAQKSLRFSGERLVELVVGGDRRVITEFVLRDGPRSRTWYPENSFRRGFVVVERGPERLEYDPGLQEIRRSRGMREEALTRLGRLLPAAAEGKLKLLEFDGGYVAGQQANGIAVADPAGNVAHRLWIDANTGLVLKAQQFARGGARLAAFEFARVNYEPIIRRGDFDLRIEGVPIVEEEHHFDVPWRLRFPAWIPEGFHETGRGLRWQAGAQVVLAHYSDGRRHFTLFQSQAAEAPRPPGMGSRRRLHLRVRRSGDVWVAVVGNLEPETLDRVVQSVR